MGIIIAFGMRARGMISSLSRRRSSATSAGVTGRAIEVSKPRFKREWGYLCRLMGVFVRGICVLWRMIIRAFRTLFWNSVGLLDSLFVARYEVRCEDLRSSPLTHVTPFSHSTLFVGPGKAPAIVLTI